MSREVGDMLRGPQVRVALLIVLMAGVLSSSGCAYLSNRGHDAREVMDIGLTVSKRPYFALSQDYFNLIPHGYSRVKGKYIGLGHGQFGTLEFDDSFWGVVLWGSSKTLIGEFDPQDPYLVRPGTEPVPTEPPRYNTGFVGMPAQGNAPPPMSFLACRRNVHLGWIGLYASMRPVEIIDFMLGWLLIDVRGDDGPRGAGEAVAAPTL